MKLKVQLYTNYSHTISRNLAMWLFEHTEYYWISVPITMGTWAWSTVVTVC